MKYQRQGDNMLKKIICILFVLVLMIGSACAETVAKRKYVFQDWPGEYTGQADSNGIPFGFGVFVSELPMDGELWHYIGDWVDGLPEGEGAIYYEDGTISKGIFSQGILIEGFIFTATGLVATAVKVERTMPETDEPAYIGNKKSKKFHYPSCKSVSQMSEKNKVEFFSREEAISLHYVPCGDCNP